MTGRNFVTRMRRGIGGVEGARGKKKKRRGFGRIGRLWKLLRHGAPWFTIFHRNVTQGHSYPSGYCRVPSEPGAVFSSFDFSSFSSFVFHFSCHFFRFFFLSRHTGHRRMCIYLGGFIFIWSGQWLWFGEFYWKIFYCRGIFERKFEVLMIQIMVSFHNKIYVKFLHANNISSHFHL